ncbi:MAG: dipeptidase PepE [Bacteroidota bacterium]|nr:dipeptidase PepE [Bacteroidota bacterium]
MKLLLISNSTNAGQEYLTYPMPHIKKFLAGEVKKVLFIPYAAVSFSYDEYQKKVQKRFTDLGIEVDSLHNYEPRDRKQAVKDAEAFVVGGGNTFHLLKMMQQDDILETMRHRCLKEIPYIGWSAGSNAACPTIKTTNDMPIVEPDSFHAINLIRFQINPHYLDANPDGHAGETREMRLEEFMVANPYVYTVGLREGSILKLENAKFELIGDKSARIFKHGEETKEIAPGDNFDFLFD